MKTNLSISIPRPCHKGWSKMIPNKKVRFCKSCSKTVVDFTKNGFDVIQNYIHKVFLMALLLAMVTTLLNCSDDKGRKQQISNVEIVKTNEKISDTVLENKTAIDAKDNSVAPKSTEPLKTKIKEKVIIDGLMITGEIDNVEPIEIDNLEIESIPHCLSTTEDYILIGFIAVDKPPEFNDTKKKYMSNRISKIITDNFSIKTRVNFDLTRKQKIIAQFKIDEQSFVKDIVVKRATHLLLEKETKAVLKLLPQFKPVKQGGQNIAVVFSLPIVFMIED
ncbi:hypothetical protein [Winogradskyella sp. UBA3174]|uniref:hypothetical protein n=1 Tax=Winogradskyella sp. UBA3174 TaxID=1947785 RepID=UPI0025EF81A3|nr:hypothetical protein [Winogradskyella sp. UBA3174]|tara:strand:+ start:11902 stop:12732 length:831 start_codon:yes stop_codon:yes gene_type:complete